MGPGRRTRWVLLCGAFVLVALTIAAVAHPGPFPGELAYVRVLQRLGGPVPRFAEFTRSVTGTEPSVVVVGLAAVWHVRRNPRVHLRVVAIALLTMLLVQPLFKTAVDRPRPNAEQVDVRAEHSSRSFPSGHSLSTATVWGAAAGLAWHRRRRGLAAAALIPIVATGVSSGIQGVHWPSDAIAGTIVGCFAAYVIVHEMNRSALHRDGVDRPAILG